MNFTFNERNSAWNKSILGGFFFKYRFWNAEPIYSIARVSDHVLRPRHSTWCLAMCDVPRLRYFICVLISHNIWCCVVIGIKESVCIIGLSWLQKVIREQIVSTKCKKPKVPCQYCQGINGGSRDVWKAYDWWEVYLFLCIILTIWMNFILISLNRVFAQ